MSKKAAIELSTNFLVIMILGIVILSMGIYLTVQAINNAKILQDKLDEETEAQIYRSLDTGEPVVAPLNTAEIQRGGSHSFGIGVRNIEYTTKFWVDVDGADVGGCDASSTTNMKYPLLVDSPNVYVTKSKTIPENGDDTFIVVVTVPKTAKPGCEYVINAKVMRCTSEEPDCRDPTEQYFAMQKFYVVVPS